MAWLMPKCMKEAYQKMNDNKAKQTKDIIANAVKENQELKDAFNGVRNELENLERKMKEIAEILLGNGKVEKEKADFVGNEADNLMMALAREQAKHDSEWASLLKELDESEK